MSVIPNVVGFDTNLALHFTFRVDTPTSRARVIPAMKA